MIKRLFLITLSYCYILAPALGVSGTTLDPSLNLYTARQLGMGGVSVAFSDDANGVFSNPACLTNLEFPQMTGSSRKLVLDETQYTLFGWAIPTNWGTFGLGYTAMSTGNSLPTKLDPGTSRIIIDPTREAMSYGNSMIALSYSKELFNWLSLGFNIKSFTQSLSGDIISNASATGYDLGLMLRPLSWASLGANLQNISEGTLSWGGGESDKIGGYYKLGAKLNLLGSSADALIIHGHRLAAGIDYDLPHNTLSSSNYHLGLEYSPFNKIALRTGLNQDGIALGIGLVNGGFRFDYAYLSRPNMPGDTPHYFTLSYIGERVVAVSHKLKIKEAGISFLAPKDRSITDKNVIPLKASTQAKKIFEQTKRWIVTAVSETKEVSETFDYEALTQVSLNGKIIAEGRIGSVETSVNLGAGRNILRITGYTEPEGLPCSAEVKVLRFHPFSDAPMTHWAIEPIALCSTLGLVKGYEENLFKPEKGITRAELITLLVRTLPVKDEDLVGAADFKDVPSSHWAAKYVAYGVDKKIVTGYPDETFKPNKVLSRAEGVTILARYAGLKEDAKAPSPFPDLKEDFWANKYIAPAKSAGLLEYLKNKEFNPSDPFTRAEACEVLYRTPAIKKMVDQWWETGVISAQQPATQQVPQPTATPATSEAE